MVKLEEQRRMNLVDEEGNEQEYIVIGELEVNNCEKYVVIAKKEEWEKEETEAMEVMVMLQKETDEEEIYETLENKELEDSILHLFQVMWNEE